MSSVSVRPRKAAKILEFALENRHNVMVTGRPAVGKTDITKQATGGLGYDLRIAHPVVDQPIDYKGLPWASKGEAGFAAYGLLEDMINADRPMVVFYDDLGQAAPMVQAAVMQVILAREINGKKISDHVRFVAATNRREDRAGVKGILEPVKSRFPIILDLEPTLEDWVSWALSAGLPPMVIAYARFRPEVITEWAPSPEIVNAPSPRTMAAAGRMLGQNPPPEILLSLLSGAIGPDSGRELYAFVQAANQIPDPDAILLNPDSAEIPDRADMKFAVAQVLAGRVSEDTFEAGCRYMARMESEYTAMFVQDAIHRKPELQRTRAFIQFASDHHDVMFDEA